MLYIGLMSGTSMDAIDAALVDLSGDRPELIASHDHPIPSAIVARLQCLASESFAIEELGEIDFVLGELFADAAIALLDTAGTHPSTIAAIGSHGQTVHHRPTGPSPFTIQLGDANVIAERTGITTVADFRRRDMAAGGQGAPLVPAYHQHVFRSGKTNRVVLNLGGIANFTVLPSDPTLPVTGFDTGPGNALMDTWALTQGRGRFDVDGVWARSGNVRRQLLQAMLADHYFQMPPPKSTGREYFSRRWIENVLAASNSSGLSPQDVQCTLAELTAVTIGIALSHLDPSPEEIYACGGGTRNPFLMERVRDRCSGYRVGTTAELGADPEWVEAMAFAWLAMRTISGEPGNITTVTGARHPVILGGIYQR